MQALQLENGEPMPRLGLGTWKSKPGEVRAAVREAIGVGYRHIDCAAAYGNEREVGAALDAAMGDGVDRAELWVTSKLWNNAHHPKNVQPALKATLHDLHLDHLDLYLMHWPVALREGAEFANSVDDLIGPDELPFTVTWEAMEACVDQGLTRYIGVSNFSAHKLQRLLDAAKIAPAMEQVEGHPYLQQDALLDFCREHAIDVTAYSPLGSSDRPESMKGNDEPILLEDPVIVSIARRHDASPAKVAIAWALQRGTAVIPKSVHAERIRQNFAAARLALTEQDMQAIARLDRHRRYLSGEFWTLPGSGYTMENLWDE